MALVEPRVQADELVDQGTEAGHRTGGPREDRVLWLRRAWNTGAVIYSSGIALSSSESSTPPHIDLWLTLIKG